jgi:hypothetical protein
MSERPRRFFLPLIGFVLLFATFGPAIGGVLFVPIAIVVEAPLAVNAAGSVGGIAALFGHGLALVFAYIVGIGPAAAAGFVYGLWDAAAPAAAPRALAAAVIGGAVTYFVFLWLAALGASFEASVSDMSPDFTVWIEAWFPRGFDVTLRDALIACGAVSGLACAMAASLIGLTTRGALALAPAPAPPASSGGG